jgi:ribosomal protein S18 acetylase RimI-like enzyme
MRGTKYTILIAKEMMDGPVIGMVEMGITADPRTVITTTTTTLPFVAPVVVDTLSIPTPPVQQQQRRVMIGILCVDTKYRGRGVASALLAQCEYIAVRQWNETTLQVQVDVTNQRALAVFEKLGYGQKEEGHELVQVRRRNTVEAIPHFLLHKALEYSKYNTTSLWNNHDEISS